MRENCLSGSNGDAAPAVMRDFMRGRKLLYMKVPIFEQLIRSERIMQKLSANGRHDRDDANVHHAVEAQGLASVGFEVSGCNGDAPTIAVAGDKSTRGSASTEEGTLGSTSAGDEMQPSAEANRQVVRDLCMSDHSDHRKSEQVSADEHDAAQEAKLESDDSGDEHQEASIEDENMPGAEESEDGDSGTANNDGGDEHQEASIEDENMPRAEESEDDESETGNNDGDDEHQEASIEDDNMPGAEESEDDESETGNNDGDDEHQEASIEDENMPGAEESEDDDSQTGNNDEGNVAYEGDMTDGGDGDDVREKYEADSERSDGDDVREKYEADSERSDGDATESQSEESESENTEAESSEGEATGVEELEARNEAHRPLRMKFASIPGGGFRAVSIDSERNHGGEQSDAEEGQSEEGDHDEEVQSEESVAEGARWGELADAKAADGADAFDRVKTVENGELGAEEGDSGERTHAERVLKTQSEGYADADSVKGAGSDDEPPNVESANSGSGRNDGAEHRSVESPKNSDDDSNHDSDSDEDILYQLAEDFDSDDNAVDRKELRAENCENEDDNDDEHDDDDDDDDDDDFETGDDFVADFDCDGTESEDFQDCEDRFSVGAGGSLNATFEEALLGTGMQHMEAADDDYEADDNDSDVDMNEDEVPDEGNNDSVSADEYTVLEGTIVNENVQPHSADASVDDAAGRADDPEDAKHEAHQKDVEVAIEYEKLMVEEADLRVAKIPPRGCFATTTNEGKFADTRAINAAEVTEGRRYDRAEAPVDRTNPAEIPEGVPSPGEADERAMKLAGTPGDAMGPIEAFGGAISPAGAPERAQAPARDVTTSAMELIASTDADDDSATQENSEADPTKAAEAEIFELPLPEMSKTIADELGEVRPVFEIFSETEPALPPESEARGSESDATMPPESEARSSESDATMLPESDVCCSESHATEPSESEVGCSESDETVPPESEVCGSECDTAVPPESECRNSESDGAPPSESDAHSSEISRLESGTVPLPEFEIRSNESEDGEALTEFQYSGDENTPNERVVNQLFNIDAGTLATTSDPAVIKMKKDMQEQRQRNEVLVTKKDALFDALRRGTKTEARLLVNLLKDHLLRIKYLAGRADEDCIVPVSKEAWCFVLDLTRTEFARLIQIVDQAAIAFASPMAKLQTCAEIVQRIEFEVSALLLLQLFLCSLNCSR